MKKSTLLLALAGLMSGTAFAANTLTTVASSGSYGHFLDSSCSWVNDYSGSSGLYRHLQCGNDTVANYAQTTSGCTLKLAANSSNYTMTGSGCYNYRISKVTTTPPPVQGKWFADAYNSISSCKWINEYSGSQGTYKRLECSGITIARIDQSLTSCSSYLTNNSFIMDKVSCWNFDIYLKQ